MVVMAMLFRNGQDIVAPIRWRVTDLAAGYTWVNQHAPADAVVMACDPIPDYLYARRLTVPYPQLSDDEPLDAYVRQTQATFIVLSPRLRSPRVTALEDAVAGTLKPHLDQHPETYRLVHVEPDQAVWVYQVVAEQAR